MIKSIDLKYFIITILLLSLHQMSFGQNQALAKQYFDDGEYEKAASIYESLWSRSNKSEAYLGLLANCYVALGDLKQAIKIYDETIKASPKLVHLLVQKGVLLANSGQEEEATKIYDQVMNKIPNDQYQISRLAYEFDRAKKWDYAVNVLTKGQQLLNNPDLFLFDLAGFYNKQGETRKMIDTYIKVLKTNPTYYSSVTTMLQRYFQHSEDYDDVIKDIYTNLEDDPSNPQMIELLSWIYIQKRDFKSAMRQLKALSMQQGDLGASVYNLSNTVFNEGNYQVAKDGYKFLMDKGPSSSYFFDASRKYFAAIVAENIRLESIEPVASDQINVDFKNYFDLYEATGRTALIAYDYADFLVRYRDELDSAVNILQKYVDRPSIHPAEKALLKLRLGDYLLIKGDRWEASLLYSQVDKDFKEDLIGQDARYRNARLSYFVGDFEWAQTQYNVLKNATSRLIANDAIDQSVFIFDNIGMDSTQAAMRIYAAAEMLIFRNKLDEANRKLDTLEYEYSDHSLIDDVLYAKAQIYKKQKKFDQAIENYNLIISKHNTEIRADNALYEMAQLYDNVLDDKEKAKELYEKLFMDFGGSVFAHDARQRFRVLRGDDIQ